MVNHDFHNTTFQLSERPMSKLDQSLFSHNEIDCIPHVILVFGGNMLQAEISQILANIS
jgi:hypothetical protein